MFRRGNLEKQNILSSSALRWETYGIHKLPKRPGKTRRVIGKFIWKTDFNWTTIRIHICVQRRYTCQTPKGFSTLQMQQKKGLTTIIEFSVTKEDISIFVIFRSNASLIRNQIHICQIVGATTILNYENIPYEIPTPFFG